MDNIEINIPDISFKRNFTIIYKGREGNIEEINTSKDEIIRKLRFFKRRTSELKEMNELYIHDSYPNDIFKIFIKSIETHKMEINDRNIHELISLSHKYEYEELEEELTKYWNKRPDIQGILDEVKTHELDSNQEEKLSKHLDICLQNDNFIKLPLPNLTRILNSPTRILHDHHLLVEFVMKIIQKYKNNNHKPKNNRKNKTVKEAEEEAAAEEERSNVQVILSSLDYTEMSNEELELFLNNEEVTSIFNSGHCKERMLRILSENRQKDEQQTNLETRITELEKRTKTQMEEMRKYFDQREQEYQIRIEKEEKEKKTTIARMKEELKRQENLINEIRKNNELLQKKQDEQNNRMKTLENIIQEKEKEKNKYQKENDELRHLITEQEKKIKYIESNVSLKVHLSAKVESDETIKCTLNIIEDLAKLDHKRSKIILNDNGRRELGEQEYEEGIEITKSRESYSFYKSQGTYFLHALIVDNFGKIEELISEPLTTKGFKYKFDYTGRVQSVHLNPGTYKLEVWGSSGGENKEKVYGGTYSDNPGKGGYSSGTLKLTKDTTLYVYVGGCPNSSNGGWNGGGSSNSSGAGGGGSSDISLYGEGGSQEWNTTEHLMSRLIVAGGGGGSSHTNYPEWQGGSGGGLNGQNCGENAVKGGTQTTGYQFGVGQSNTKLHNSGGGGGWFGGYAYNTVGGWGRGGGGGSGFVYNSSTARNYPSGCRLDSSFYLTDSQTISGNENGHNGNGYAEITPQ